MKKLFWRIAYALHAAAPIIRRGVDLRTAWYLSGEAEDWQERSPRDAADEEISYATL